jgi:hypothetical protein
MVPPSPELVQARELAALAHGALATVLEQLVAASQRCRRCSEAFACERCLTTLRAALQLCLRALALVERYERVIASYERQRRG